MTPAIPFTEEFIGEQSDDTEFDTEEAAENPFDAEDILFMAVDDFDQDGNCETFAFKGKTASDGIFCSGSILYEANGEITVVCDKAVYEDIFVFEVGDGTKYLCLRVNTAHNNSLIYGVKDSLPEETVLSDIGQRFTLLSNDEFTLEHSALDGTSLSSGHTIKPYYFYYDNGFHEYGATEISVEEFMGYDNALEYLSYIENKNGEVQSVLRRNNHIIHINYACEMPNTLQPVWQNFNLTLNEHNNVLTLVEENDGVYLDSMVPDIAVY